MLGTKILKKKGTRVVRAILFSRKFYDCKCKVTKVTNR
jgi:hypothetical protein